MTTLPIHLVRLTLVGSTGVGKTMLIDSYVNRSTIDENDPWEVGSTTEPELYHKLAILPKEEDDVASDIQRQVLVELEDTPPSTLLALRQEIMAGIDVDAIEQQPKMVLDAARLQHPSAQYLDATRAGAFSLPEGVEDLMPVGVFEYPREFPANGPRNLKSLTQGRMGIMIVFSLPDRESLLEAIEIHEVLTLMRERQHWAIQPLTFLIGNKADQVGRSQFPDIKDTITDAEKYANRSRLPFFRVSAATGKGVDRVFNDMVVQITQVPSLVTFDILPRAGAETEHEEEEEGEEED